VSRPERPVPPPLEGNDRLITAVITAGWVIGLIVLLAVRGQLALADRWWIWVAAFGTLQGLFGLAYVPYLKRSRERAAERRRAAEPTRPADVGPADVAPADIGPADVADVGAADAGPADEPLAREQEKEDQASERNGAPDS
jgi:hypothetical protein